MMNSDVPILRAVQINKQYPGVKALNNVDFELQPGEYVPCWARMELENRH